MLTVETTTSPPKETRKLAAIVSVDVVGYSKLMQIDQSATHLRIKDLGVRDFE